MGIENLLKLQLLALNFCKTVIGNCHTTSFWFDVWTPLHQLIKYISSHDLEPFESDNVMWLLTQLQDQHGFDLIQDLSRKLIFTLTLPLYLFLYPYATMMFRNGLLVIFLCGFFNSATTWEVIRPKQEAKDWMDIVWFNDFLPKQSFTMWIENGDRLPTRNILELRGTTVPITCFSAQEKQRLEVPFMNYRDTLHE